MKKYRVVYTLLCGNVLLGGRITLLAREEREVTKHITRRLGDQVQYADIKITEVA